MYLESCLICVDYADYLQHTLPRNKDYFDKMVVVTNEKDIDTINVCKDNNVECILTDKMYINGNKFNKGAALNEGFNKLSKKDWICTFDADIILQEDFRNLIEKEELNKDLLYGTQRVKIRYYEDFLLWEKNEPIKLSYKDPCYASGFFQLFNIESKFLKDKNNIYPNNIKDALGDIHFRSYWGDNKFGKTTENMVKLNKYITHVIHLPHSKHNLGKDVHCVRNWSGRVTLPFHLQNRNKKKCNVEDIDDLFS